MRRFPLWLLLVLLLPACEMSGYGTTNPVEPVIVTPTPPPPTPVEPPPIPIPVPIPVPETGVVQWTVIKQITTGMTRDQLVKLLGSEPEGERSERDGGITLRWKAVDNEGVKRYLDVQVLPDPAAPTIVGKQKVEGRALVRR